MILGFLGFAGFGVVGFVSGCIALAGAAGVFAGSSIWVSASNLPIH
jgi:hypothetical protein